MVDYKAIEDYFRQINSMAKAGKKDYEGIERYFAQIKRSQNCIPQNIREWENFFHIYNTYTKYTVQELDRSFVGIKATDVKTIHPMYENPFKASPWECAIDIKNSDTLDIFSNFGFDLSFFKKVIKLYSYINTCRPSATAEGIIYDILPRHIAGSLNLSNLLLTSLKGMSLTVGGDVDISNNVLTNLEYCSTEIGGDFIVKSKYLKSLKGGPKIVKGRYDVSFSSLTDLSHGPEIVGKSFIVSNSYSLTSLKGGPRIVGGDYRLTKCHKLKSIDGVAEYIGGSLICGSPVSGQGPSMVQHGCTFIRELPDGNPRMWGNITKHSF